MSDLSGSRTTRAIDARSEKNTRLLPYLKNNRAKMPPIRIRSKHSLSNQNNQTHVRRYDENQSTTILSIRFASSQAHTKKIQDQLMFIKDKKKSDKTEQNQQNCNEKALPYLNYRRYESPEQHLKNLGYDSDIRIAAQIYSDKVQQKKLKYLNKMQALKRELDNYTSNKRHHRMEKSRIQIKILGEQIKRKRQRQCLQREQRKGHQMLYSLLSTQ